MAKEGEVIYELRGDDSNLEKDLNDAEKKVEQSAKKTGETSEKYEKETGETQKKVKEDVTQHHKQQNDEREKDDEDSSHQREETAKTHGEKLKSIAAGSAKAIGASMAAVGTAAVGIGVAAVKGTNDMDQAMNGYIAATGKSKPKSIKEFSKTFTRITMAIALKILQVPWPLCNSKWAISTTVSFKVLLSRPMRCEILLNTISQSHHELRQQ